MANNQYINKVVYGDQTLIDLSNDTITADILVSGYTHELSIKTKDNVLYINPGSISGAFSPSIKENSPSFILLALQGDIAIIYSYIFINENKKSDVKKYEYTIGTNEFKEIKNDEEEDNI